MKVIVRNKALCGRCGHEVESRSRHDFVTCPCGAISVEGGLEYLRRVGNPIDVIELSEFKEAAE